MECQSDLLVHSQVWINYKQHSTVIGITPQGTILFIFECAMSDKEIIEQSGIMDLLLPGTV